MLVTIRDNPAWAAHELNGPVDLAPIQDYYSFVAAVGARYGRAPYTVRMWEIYERGRRRPQFRLSGRGIATILDQAANPQSSSEHPGRDGRPRSPTALMTAASCPLFSRISWPPEVGAATDAINFHSYGNSGWGSLAATVAALRATMAQARVDLPLIWTEGGMSSNPAYGGQPRRPGSLCAQSLCERPGPGRKLHDLVSPSGLTDPAFWYFENHGLLTLDGTPKPAYTAYGVATHYLTATTFVRAQTPAELGGNPDAEGYYFRRADGGGLVVAWANAGTATETWPAAQVQAARDALGASFGYSIAGGQAVIAVTDSPVYVELTVAAGTPPPATPSPAPPTGLPGSPGPATSPTPCAPAFRDVQASDYFSASVRALVCAGVMDGYADATFRPYNGATRGQVSKVLALAMDWPAVPGAGQVFADVPPENAYYSFIQTAAAHGIISGISCGGPAEPCDSRNRAYFRPNAAVTRGQFSKLLALAHGWTDPGPGSPHFADVPPGQPFFGYIEAAYRHGVINGYAGGAFRPAGIVTRGQLAKMIHLAAGQP